jgi:hypothetical protein
LAPVESPLEPESAATAAGELVAVDSSEMMVDVTSSSVSVLLDVIVDKVVWVVDESSVVVVVVVVSVVGSTVLVVVRVGWSVVVVSSSVECVLVCVGSSSSVLDRVGRTGWPTPMSVVVAAGSSCPSVE